MKGQLDRGVEESRRKLSDKQMAWLDKAAASGVLFKDFNTGLFTYGASSKPETAGIGVALVGSIYMMLIVLLIAVPIGVAAAVYLEEFAPKNLLTDTIEVNINNLAAVPSIVFGLLGLAIFINFIGTTALRLSRRRPGAGARDSCPPSLSPHVPPSARCRRRSAKRLSASAPPRCSRSPITCCRWPCPAFSPAPSSALPRLSGETAPLLMIGMVAFVVDYPVTPLDSATALPVQIYMWATAAERGFVERTAGATLILLAFLVCMNVTAVILRRRYERRW